MTRLTAKRIATWAAAWLALPMAIASAGDIASFRPIGFSADGTVFAFEEYGIQDGSGFPYSNILAIDTVKDSYLDGTPVRVRLDDEAIGLGKARAEAAAKAAPILAPLSLDDHPGALVAFNPVSEGTANSHGLRYQAFTTDPAIGGAYGLRLEEIATPSEGDCKALTPQVRTFRLVVTARDGKAANEKLYQDASLPKSRNCPSGYRLGGIVTYTPAAGGKTIHVALVMVLSPGFEGRDGRWIAVALRP